MEERLTKNEADFHTVRGYQLQDRRDGRMTSAMEDYLEMICRLCSQDGYTRVRALSERLNVRPSSASKMVGRLAQLGLVKYERYEIIQLTERGRELGEFLLARHRTIERFLQLIGLKDTLLEETELIEHSISRETLELMRGFCDFLEAYPAVYRLYRDFRSKRQQQ